MLSESTVLKQDDHKQNISEAEQRVIRQVVEALLFEKIIDFEQAPRVPADGAFDAVFDLRIDFVIGGKHFHCVGAIKAFDRVRIAQGSIKLIQGSNSIGFRIYELLACLNMDNKSKHRLCAELAQTIALCEWNRANLDLHQRNRRVLGFQELESAIHEGHLYHPCFKTRTGFSEKDHQLYGPEAGNAFQLHWLAVARRYVNIALPQTKSENEQDFWQRELGKRQFDLLTSRLQAQGGAWSEYALVPVHPWQRQSIRELGIDEAIAAGEILDLGIAGDYYQATQSMRTLVNASYPEKANVKVPINIVCTSSRRNLQQHFVCTAPAISQWLNALVAKDAFLQQKQLILLSEYAGMLYEPEHHIGVTDEDTPQGLLGAIFRESAMSKLQDGEAAVPYTALMLMEADGQPFIAEWLKDYGVEAWVNRLLDVMLIPLWHMLVHHGVALEVHAQNLILIHKQGWPEKIAVRDFHENTEYVDDYLASPQELPDFESIDPYFRTIPDDDGYRMTNVDELRELVMDTALVFNLADLSFLLERFFNFNERNFWRAVRQHLNSYKHSGVTDIERINRLACDNREIIVESLLKKKISGSGILQLYHHRVRNMLYSNEAEDQAMFYVDDNYFDQNYVNRCFALFEQHPIIGQCKGKRITVCLDDPAFWVVLCLFLKSQGTSVFPLATDTPLEAARRRAQRSGSHYLLFGKEGEAALEDIEVLERCGEDSEAVLVQMSSGTTGEPKVIERTWVSIDTEIDNYIRHFNAANEMTPIVVCPVNHSYGLICGVLVALKRGQCPRIIRNLNPKYILRKLHEVTKPIFYSSPTLIATITMLASEKKPIYAVMTSGTIIQKAWFETIRNKVVHLYQQYGCSEAGCIALGEDISEASEIGKPLPHVEVVAGSVPSEPAEIVVKLKDSNANSIVHTRDLGYFDKSGNLHFVARLDDMINVAGLNVYPGEVEEVVLEMPQVTDAVVFKRRHSFGNDQVCLNYVSAVAIPEQQIRDWCARKLASHQVPMSITRVDVIPKLPNGKVSRKALAETAPA